MRAAKDLNRKEVSPESLLCLWRSLAAILLLTQHPDQGNFALILKQKNCEWGTRNATKVAKQLECPVKANEKCFAIASLYFDLKLLIVDENSSTCWGLHTLQHGEDTMKMWPLWCKD
eukprot:6489619-Amphidinium_carterae.5